MSGCTDTNKCECTCHVNGMKFVLTSNPPKYCCTCGLSLHLDSLITQEELKGRLTRLERVFIETNDNLLRISDEIESLEAAFEVMKKILDIKTELDLLVERRNKRENK